jgi:hypothetical protein
MIGEPCWAITASCDGIGSSHPSTEAQIMSIFRPHPKVRPNPKVLDIEVPSDVRIKEFVLFF